MNLILYEKVKFVIIFSINNTKNLMEKSQICFFKFFLKEKKLQQLLLLQKL